MVLAAAVALAVGALVFTLFVGARSIPAAEPQSPIAHLEEKKARIYENLRDLQFEYRLGKLSDEDYQKTKQSLQRELAAVLAEIDTFGSGLPRKAPPPPVLEKVSDHCPHCGARFPAPMKFCGACGKAMA